MLVAFLSGGDRNLHHWFRSVSFLEGQLFREPFRLPLQFCHRLLELQHERSDGILESLAWILPAQVLNILDREAGHQCSPESAVLQQFHFRHASLELLQEWLVPLYMLANLAHRHPD